MPAKTYSIFGAGAAGLYTAWRLLSGKARHAKDKGKLLGKGDTLELYDWGKYDFSKKYDGTREPGARVCTWHYENDPKNSYLELGGMRYSQWDSKAKDANDGKTPGHRVVSTVIEQLGLQKYSVPFNESANPLFYLRTKNINLNDFSSANPAPYHVDGYGADTSPDTGFNIVENLAVTATSGPRTRKEWNDFYQNGRITAELPEWSIFQKGDLLSDIGYWNLMYDQLGGEGYNYAADGNGYTSNVINWNSADAFNANNEFTPGNQYNTLTTGYSGMFAALFDAIVDLCKSKGVGFKYYPNTRLHSILAQDEGIVYTYATREKPWSSAGSRPTDAAWLAMPRYAIDLVGQATRYNDNGDAFDVLNNVRVRNYLDAAIMQPSYKIGMFFDSPWWLDDAVYKAPILGWVVTDRVLAQLKKDGYPASYLKAMQPLLLQQFAAKAALVSASKTQSASG